MRKANTRDWWSWRICWCKEGKHIVPPEDMEFSFDKEGNSSVDPTTFCSVCPLFTGQLFRRMHNSDKFHIYRKWAPGKRGGPGFSKQNHGNLVELAMEFCRAQGVLAEGESFDSKDLRLF